MGRSYHRFPMRHADRVVVLESVDAGLVRVTAGVHGRPRRRAARILVERVNKRRAHGRQPVDVRRKYLSQRTVGIAAPDAVECGNGIRPLVIGNDPENVRFLTGVLRGQRAPREQRGNQDKQYGSGYHWCAALHLRSSSAHFPGSSSSVRIGVWALYLNPFMMDSFLVHVESVGDIFPDWRQDTVTMSRESFYSSRNFLLPSEIRSRCCRFKPCW